ncbi:MAG TPA: hypothetical protein VJ776_07125, partial [Thermoanaerobaculia bacterium]|nr:hypothetical protein [Thermoanaerobaculia bacterium]
CVPLPAQNRPRQDTFAERVEVKVRTVVAVVTDREGKRPLPAPSPADLEVLENGAATEIVGVEPLPRSRTPAPDRGSSVRAPDAASGSPTVADPVAQVLYMDPQFVYRGSANLYVRTLSPVVEALLARGPLQIVVAGPSPRNVLAATSEPALLQAALKTLPKEATGTDSLFESRRRLMDSPRVIGDWEMVARVFIARDIERIEASLEKLELWAATNRPASPTILYLVNDGFELDPTDFYLTCRRFCPPSAIQERERFRNTFANRVPQAMNRVSAELVSLGFIVVPVTTGTTPIFSSNDSPQQRPLSTSRSFASAIRPIPGAPVSLAWQPTDPLRKVAEATGGEVVVGAERLRQVLDHFNDAYAVSYRSRAAGESGVRSLEVRSTRPGLIVRAARVTAGGAAAAEILAHGRATAALESGSGGPLSVAVHVEGREKTSKGLMAGKLVVTTDLASAAEALAKVGPARARVTLAVETDDPTPFLTSEELDLDRSGKGTIWTYEVSMTWPRQARRVSVLVEEIRTGLFGTASTELPR